MLATPIWEGIKPIGRSFQKRFKRRAACVLAVLLLAVGAPGLGAFAAPATNAAPTQLSFAEKARKVFVEARNAYLADTNSAEAAWKYARACFDLGEFAATNKDRAEVAETGIAVARALIAREPNSVEGHYYLAMNMGQLARTKSLGALRLVDLMEKEFITVRRLNERFDYAGADRNLGLLYLEAPSFGSIGSRTKARFHLRRAAELAADYPENRLNLIEAFVRWGDTRSAAVEFNALTAILPAAREKFTGADWALSWKDWEARYSKLKSHLGDAAQKLKTPRESQR